MNYDPGQPQQPGYRRDEPLPPDFFSSLQNSSRKSPYNGALPRSGRPFRQKKNFSRRWVGALIAIICVLIVGTILIVKYLNTLAGPVVTINSYYQAVSQKDYTLAYSYLASNATLTSQNQKVPIGPQQEYVTSAQLLDSHIGTVTTYNVATTNNNTLLTINITRNKNTHIIRYSTRFTMVQVDGNWKIKDMNGGF